MSQKQYTDQNFQVSIACYDGIVTLKYSEKNSVHKGMKIGDFVIGIPQKKGSHYLFVELGSYSQITSQIMYSCLNMIA